ncbi:MAG: SprT family zinc-dependent metalloprotease [Desulfococcaceae bacterium]|jgi:predicted metal-dependent hydrolase|nr:SprT family zinc-dependent metalloprotease [Desulfococcaceae bacterium]
MKDSVKFGRHTIEYDLKFSRRKTLGISVNPDASVSVTAPEGKEPESIRILVKKRAPWILKQQQAFEKARPLLTARRYVSGETWRYLGRQYRLKISEEEGEKVKLSRGYIHITVKDRKDTERIKDLLTDWYRQKAGNYFDSKIKHCHGLLRKYGIEQPQFRLRTMRTRWGSCTREGMLILHPDLVKMPSQCVEYVIMHEMCHLKHHDHSPGFYGLLSKVMPDWEKRKERLEDMGHEVLG